MKAGDRVRLVVEGIVAPDGDGVPGALILGTSPDHLPLVDPVVTDYSVTHAAGEAWHTGDVVRDGGDHRSPDLWVWYGEDAAGGPRWTTTDGVETDRQRMPSDLKLVARHGHPVKPKATAAMRDAAYAEFERRRNQPYGEQMTGREAFGSAVEYLLLQMGLDNEWVPF